jgi:hypothetical protein
MGQAAVPEAAAWGPDQAEAAPLPQASGQERIGVWSSLNTSRPHANGPALSKERESQADERVFPVLTMESHSKLLEPVMPFLLIYGAIVGVIGFGGLFVRHLHRSLDVID